jgi:hypothetical protein
MPTAAGHFPRLTSQNSKENVCDEIHRHRTGTAASSSSKCKQKAAVGTPSKYFSSDSEESVLHTSFRTPNRPESNAQPKRRYAACGSIKKTMNYSDKFTLEATESDVAEQLHSLRKEKSQLEAQNCDLQVNFAQVKSQLEAVLLYKEVCLAMMTADNCKLANKTTYFCLACRVRTTTLKISWKI